MKLGGFGRIADYEKIQAAGFDFAELDVPEIEALPEEEFQILCDKIRKTGFPVLTGARALPIADPWFFTDRFSMDEYKNYLEHACRRANMIGMKCIIIGNGKARLLTDETSISKESRFIDFMRMFAEIAEKNHLEVILEPLGPKYSNYINTLPEAVRVIKEIGMPNVFAMADLRHMVWAKETLEDIVTYADYIHHIHVDYPLSWPERPFPDTEDDYDYTDFLNAVRKSGYQGTITVEADIPEDWNEAHEKAMAVLKDVLNK
ncbi:MAG: sugar phosphate isomerase/epimerase family protein [Lachnospiraceae bacterium]|nr:sugar phosphate isomerase/epimerase family protein [Lachnospiraceae bacterium]